MNKQYSDDLHSLSHTKWSCKYHIVFAPKYRRRAFYEARRVEVGAILRQLCEWKGVNIIEAEVCIDHVHMLVEIPPKYDVAGCIVCVFKWRKWVKKNGRAVQV